MLTYTFKHRGGEDENGLGPEEREKIIDILLSQERVLTLLYDKAFPPRITPKLVGETLGTIKRGFE